MPANPKITFTGSSSTGVASHKIAWFVNNVAATLKVQPALAIPGFPYTSFFQADNPTVTLAPGDVVHADVYAVDASGLESVKVPVSVSVPADPPLPPTAVTLGL